MNIRRQQIQGYYAGIRDLWIRGNRINSVSRRLQPAIFSGLASHDGSLLRSVAQRLWWRFVPGSNAGLDREIFPVGEFLPWLRHATSSTDNFEIGLLVVYRTAFLPVCQKRANRAPGCFMTDDQFVTAFTGCTTRSQELPHHDHVRMGCLNMSRFPGFGGIGRFSEGLERLAGASRKLRLYHKTDHLGLPVVDPGAFSAILQQSGRQPSWDEFAADNKDLLRGKDYVLKEYYRDETLKISIGEKNIHLAG